MIGYLDRITIFKEGFGSPAFAGTRRLMAVRLPELIEL
jgi:hypothetical protein